MWALITRDNGDQYHGSRDIYGRAINWSYASRHGSLFDMAYNTTRAQGLAPMMHPRRDPLP